MFLLLSESSLRTAVGWEEIVNLLGIVLFENARVIFNIYVQRLEHFGSNTSSMNYFHGQLDMRTFSEHTTSHRPTLTLVNQGHSENTKVSGRFDYRYRFESESRDSKTFWQF